MCGPFDKGAIDAELLGRLLDEHGPALALYAAQWTDAADDCVQEALVELARQPARPEHVVAWMYRVVKHRALNAARSARRRREREARSVEQRFVVAESPSAVDRYDALAVVEALTQLESQDRQIIVMRLWGGLTYDQIAAALSVSTSTAHRNYASALEHLREILEVPCTTNQNAAGRN
jgi:RNA polymerase sigma factor (sigma-70 family)